MQCRWPNRLPVWSAAPVLSGNIKTYLAQYFSVRVIAGALHSSFETRWAIPALNLAAYCCSAY